MSVTQVVRSLQGLLGGAEAISAEDLVFSLHHKYTSLLFVAGAILVSSRQFFGEPIHCQVDGVSEAVANSFCWMEATYTMPSEVGGPYPGVVPGVEGEEVRHQTYYQWVWLILALEATAFSLPKLLWNRCERSKVQMLVRGLTEPTVQVDLQRVQLIAGYFQQHRGTHASYALKYFFCEILNLVNVIGQIYFLDLFLGYEFRTYGLDVVKYSEMEPEDRQDPMQTVFPKMTKCTFRQYGRGGRLERRELLCVLPLNTINEKVFILVWFWMVILAGVTAAFLVFRLATLLSPHLRAALIARLGNKTDRSGSRRCDVKTLLDPAILNPAIPESSALEKIGDWLVLYFVCKNLPEATVDVVIEKMQTVTKY